MNCFWQNFFIPVYAFPISGENAVSIRHFSIESFTPSQPSYSFDNELYTVKHTSPLHLVMFHTEMVKSYIYVHKLYRIGS